MRDLVLLVPDKNTEFTVRGAIGRNEALGVRPIDYTIIVDPGRDGGVRKGGKQILDVQRPRFTHGVMLLDYEGCGSTDRPDELEAALDEALASSWGTNAKAIVIRPEVDIWMWGNDAHLHNVLGSDFGVGVRAWLRENGFAFDANDKPARPKEALEAIFRQAKLPRSSATYKDLAGRLSLANCTDQSFRRLQASLVQRFPPAHQ